MTTTTTVPAKYDVGLDGRGYMIDTQYLEAYRSQTLDPIRRQADTSDSVGEASLNPEGYWRRSPESFHKGAGQARYDANDSDPERFLSSTGVDVWTEGQLSLLPATEEVGTLAITGGSTVRDALVAEPYSIVLDSAGTIYRTSTLTGPLSVVNSWSGPLGNITAFDLLGSDGFIIDTNKLYRTNNVFSSGGGGTLWITDNPDVTDVRVVGDRLFCTSGNNLYDISATGLTTLPAPLVIGGMGKIIAAETNGYFYFQDANKILKTTIKADGSGLEVPTVAATVPSGEVVWHVIGYLGFVVLVTSLASGGPFGLRLGVAATDGTLTLGARFADEGIASHGVAFQFGHATVGQFIYLLSGNSLMRLDLSTINDALEPAYAKDIAFTGQPQACSVGLNGIYAVELDGTFHRTTSSFVTSGQIDMGEVSFGTREPKLFLDPVETATDGTVSHLFRLPDGSTVSNDNTATAEPAVSWIMTLFPTTAGQDMTVQYPILRALPSPAYIEIKSVPILLHDQIINRQSQAEQVDTDAQLDYLRGLRDAGTLIDYQDGSRTQQAQVIGVDWVASQRDLAGDQWNGTAVVRMKVLQ